MSDRTTKPKGTEESWPVTSLREYLKGRRGEIRAEHERLTRQRDKLQNQLHAVLARLDELDRESADVLPLTHFARAWATPSLIMSDQTSGRT